MLIVETIRTYEGEKNMREDTETWKCVAIGLLVLAFACISILAGRVDFQLSTKNRRNFLQQGVIFSRVITSEGDHIITENLVVINP